MAAIIHQFQPAVGVAKIKKQPDFIDTAQVNIGDRLPVCDGRRVVGTQLLAVFRAVAQRAVAIDQLFLGQHGAGFDGHFVAPSPVDGRRAAVADHVEGPVGEGFIESVAGFRGFLLRRGWDCLAGLDAQAGQEPNQQIKIIG